MKVCKKLRNFSKNAMKPWQHGVRILRFFFYDSTQKTLIIFSKRLKNWALRSIPVSVYFWSSKNCVDDDDDWAGKTFFVFYFLFLSFQGSKINNWTVYFSCVGHWASVSKLYYLLGTLHRVPTFKST